MRSQSIRKSSNNTTMRSEGNISSVSYNLGVENHINSLHMGIPSCGETNIVATKYNQFFQTPLPIDNREQLGIVSPRKPRTASEWFDRNKTKLKKYTGKYIAITHIGVIAISDDLDDVYMKSKQQGFVDPLVFKVPKPSSQKRIRSVKTP